MYMMHFYDVGASRLNARTLELARYDRCGSLRCLPYSYCIFVHVHVYTMYLCMFYMYMYMHRLVRIFAYAQAQCVS